MKYIVLLKKNSDYSYLIKPAFEMIGVLLQVGIQGPFSASSSSCLNGTETVVISNASNTSNTNINSLTLWDQQKFFFFAIIIAAIFISAQSMLLLFVPEKNGNFICIEFLKF